jgi:hypothetical protein
MSVAIHGLRERAARARREADVLHGQGRQFAVTEDRERIAKQLYSSTLYDLVAVGLTWMPPPTCRGGNPCVTASSTLRGPSTTRSSGCGLPSSTSTRRARREPIRSWGWARSGGRVVRRRRGGAPWTTGVGGPARGTSVAPIDCGGQRRRAVSGSPDRPTPCRGRRPGRRAGAG